MGDDQQKQAILDAVRRGVIAQSPPTSSWDRARSVLKTLEAEGFRIVAEGSVPVSKDLLAWCYANLRKEALASERCLDLQDALK